MDSWWSGHIDDDSMGTPVGIEFWNVHCGLNLDGVSARETVSRLLEAGHVRVFA